MIQYVRRKDKLKAEMNVKAASILLSFSANNSYASTKTKPEAVRFGFLLISIYGQRKNRKNQVRRIKGSASVMSKSVMCIPGRKVRCESIKQKTAPS